MSNQVITDGSEKERRPGCTPPATRVFGRRGRPYLATSSHLRRHSGSPPAVRSVRLLTWTR